MSVTPSLPEHRVRRAVADCAALLWERGYVANHDGNVTSRAAPGRIVATPTGVSKRLVDVDQLIIVDEQRRVVAGRGRPFSELGLHLAAYAARPDIGAVVHAHPPYATARATMEQVLPCFVPEAVVSLGREVPLVPFALPGDDAVRALAPYFDGFDAVLLARHGVLAWGADVEQAFLRLELVEHLAKIAALTATGCPPPLPEAAVERLLDARRRAGLGRPSRG